MSGCMSGGLPDVRGPDRAEHRGSSGPRDKGDPDMSSVLDTAVPSDNAVPSARRRAGRTPAGRPLSTLSIAASGTALVMAVFSAFVVNVGDSVRTFHAGIGSHAWGLSGMSLGL